jgi:prefoldin subunit 5
VPDALDETAQLNARLRMAEALIERLKQRIAELEAIITKT